MSKNDYIVTNEMRDKWKKRDEKILLDVRAARYTDCYSITKKYDISVSEAYTLLKKNNINLPKYIENDVSKVDELRKDERNRYSKKQENLTNNKDNQKSNKLTADNNNDYVINVGDLKKFLKHLNDDTKVYFKVLK